MAKRPPKWKGSKVIDDIDDALDRATAQFLTNARSKLSAASPVLTGRLASSWNIGKNNPDLSAPPERDKPGPIQLKPYGGTITYGGNWFIDSNLPYTFRAAYDPYNGRRGGVIGLPELRTASSQMQSASLLRSYPRSNDIPSHTSSHRKQGVRGVPIARPTG